MDPSVGRPVLNSLAGLLDSPSSKVRGNAAGLMSDIAKRYPEDVDRYQTDIADTLYDPDETVRGNAVSAILHIGLDNPSAVEDTLPALVELLDDPSPVVRRNVARALGNMEATIAIEQLRLPSDSDPDEGVRQIASWAVDRIVE